MTMPNITDEIASQVLQTDQPVVFFFTAEWCGRCKILGPTLEQLSDEFSGRAVIYQVNVDNCPQTAMKYGVRSPPEVIFIKNSKVVDKHVGSVPKTVLQEKLSAQLS